MKQHKRKLLLGAIIWATNMRIRKILTTRDAIGHVLTVWDICL